MIQTKSRFKFDKNQMFAAHPFIDVLNAVLNSVGTQEVETFLQ